MEKYLPIIEEKQDMFLFLTMLFPFFPDDALCMLAGLTKIPLGRFVAIMALARPWGLVVAALLGSGSLSLPVWAWAVIGGAGLLIFCVRDEIQRADRRKRCSRSARQDRAEKTIAPTESDSDGWQAGRRRAAKNKGVNHSR